jgi:hypothetical protein
VSQIKKYEKVETLLCSAVGTAVHQHGLEACTAYGTSRNAGIMTSAERAKLAALLEACTKEEQRSVNSSVLSDGVKPIEIHRRM